MLKEINCRCQCADPQLRSVSHAGSQSGRWVMFVFCLSLNTQVASVLSSITKDLEYCLNESLLKSGVIKTAIPDRLIISLRLVCKI